MLEYITVMQTSDLHIESPERPDWHGVVDNQYGALPDGTLSRASISPPRRAKLELRKIIEKSKPDVVLFQGDLGFQGDPVKLAAGVAFLSDILGAAGLALADVRGLIGNHDVCWTVESANKFEPVLQAWVAGAGEAPPVGIQHETVTLGNSSLHLVSANSCQDSGVVDPYPDSVRPTINKLLDDFKASHANEPIEAGLFRMLDIPSIGTEQIDNEVGAHLFSERGLIVFQAHHSALPQNTPRMEFCPELIQAGYLRNTLLSMKRTILYLHGHIHSHCAYLVADPAFPESQVVFIGCPQFPLGFNIIQIAFEDGTPIRAEVESYAQRPEFGTYEVAQTVNVSLLSPSERTSRLTEAHRRVLGEVVSKGTAFLRELDTCDDVEGTASLVKDMEILGFLEIVNSGASPADWRVSSAGIG